MQTVQYRSGDDGGDAGVLRIGTRGSRLALAQANWVADALRHTHPGLNVELVIIQTTGDRILDSSLNRIGGKGVFTREIEIALLDGRIDVAVHSLKDLPTTQPAGLALAAITEREDPRDVLLAARPIRLEDLTAQDTVGTSSLRRRAQLMRLSPRVRVADIRGNVPTRLRRMLDGEYTAIVLAAAGLIRLELEVPYIQFMDDGLMLPAPGQGALGLQARADDVATASLLAALHHHDSARCCLAERAVLQGLGGGCQLPLATLATIDSPGFLMLQARVLNLDGSESIESSVLGPEGEAEALGQALAIELLRRGADRLLEGVRATSPEDGFERAVSAAEALDQGPLGGATVLITRDEDADGPLSMSIRGHGGHPLCIPLVAHESPDDPGPLMEAAARLYEYDWLVLTSARAVEALVPLVSLAAKPSPRLACVGEGTARAVRAAGGEVTLVGPEGNAQSLADAMRSHGDLDGARILFPAADRAAATIETELAAAGARVDRVTAYVTRLLAPQNFTQTLATNPPAAALFCSPSAVAAWQALQETTLPPGCLVGSMGPSTSQALAAAGLPVHFTAETRTFDGLAAALVAAITAQRKEHR